MEEEEVKLDEIDLKIIEILQNNARTSFREIAKMLKISPQTVSNRVAKLIKEGIILSFITITNPMKLKKGILAFIEVNVKPGQSERVAREITNLKDGVIVFETIGTHDLILYGFFKDHKDLANFVNNQLGKIKEVDKVSIDFCIKKY
ncbi:MAG: Lrp/AsnC family transcriptional regulator [Candidatus Baldrarchaeia archaeon]